MSGNGALPTGWSAATVAELATAPSAIAYGVLQPGPETVGGVPMLRVKDIRGDVVNLDVVYLIAPELHAQYQRTSLVGGEVVISIQGTVGRVALVPDDLAGGNVSRTLAIIPPAQAEHAKWLWVALRTPQVQEQMRGLTGGTTRDSLNLRDLRAVVLPVPPFNEQRRIVDKIEALTERSRRAKEALDAIQPLLERFRQSVLAAAFRGDLTADWRAKNPDVEPADRLLERIRVERRRRWEEDHLTGQSAQGKKPTNDKWKAKYVAPEPVDAEGLPELPEGWCWAALEDLAFVESGQTPKGLAEHAESGGNVPWFRVGDMNADGNELLMKSGGVLLSALEVRSFGLHVRPAGTIIFPKRGGAIATNKKRLLSQPSAYDLNTMGLVPVAQSVAAYLWWWFQSVDLRTLNDGSTVPQLNHGDIAPLPVPLPPLEELHEIVELAVTRLACRDRIATTVDNAREPLATLDGLVLAKAFRGELVPQDPEDEPASEMLARLVRMGA